MAYTLQDSYEGSAINGTSVSSNTWGLQTFTASSSYTATKLGFYGYKADDGSTGTVTIGIYATAAGLPTGGALGFYTSDISTMAESPTEDWFEVVLSSGVALTSGTVYAIVLSYAIATGTPITVRLNASNVYANGARIRSTDGGSSWSTPGGDARFRVYSGSDVEYIDVTGTITGSGTVSATIFQQIQNVTGTIAGTGSISGGGAGSATVTSYKPIFKKRLIAIGNDRLFYEDL